MLKERIQDSLAMHGMNDERVEVQENRDAGEAKRLVVVIHDPDLEIGRVVEVVDGEVGGTFLPVRHSHAASAQRGRRRIS